MNLCRILEAMCSTIKQRAEEGQKQELEEKVQGECFINTLNGWETPTSDFFVDLIMLP